MTITEPLANAAAMDAANRQMQAAGRTVWSEDDYNLAVWTKAHLLGYCPTCCCDLPDCECESAAKTVNTTKITF